MGTCEYFNEREWRFQYFFAEKVNARELDMLLQSGWRKFGRYYFRPVCEGCRACIPIRIPVREYSPSRNQRRVSRKGREVKVEFNPLQYRDEIYEIYRDHSLNRFGNRTECSDFITSFYSVSCPSMQAEYYIDGVLAGVSFLDRSEEALNSVYFIFRNEFQSYRLGTLSVVREVYYAASQGLKFYYLGYYVDGNRRMRYKDYFRPNQKYEWHKEKKY